MNEETKKTINAKYERELNISSERFWPDSIFKDVIVALGIFVLLVMLATFVGVLSIQAAPTATWYVDVSAGNEGEDRVPVTVTPDNIQRAGPDGSCCSKDGDPDDYPSWGPPAPQGDVQRVFNYVRCVR